MTVAEYLGNTVPDQAIFKQPWCAWKIGNWKSGGKTVPLHAMKTYEGLEL
jgi:hypothetical protein